MRTLPVFLVLLISILVMSGIGCAAKQQGPTAATPPAAPQAPNVITRIGFASCAHQDRPQPIWSAILQSRPELFILLGDNIYADTEDMAVMKAKYQKFGAVEGFAQLRRTVPILATWDDHDMGKNDAGADYTKRAEAQKLFLEFFADPPSSGRWNREGVYESYTYGPEGKRVQVILLDTRYHRSPLKNMDPPIRTYAPTDSKADKDGFIYTPSRSGRYAPDPDPAKTMLGDAQWTWLEQQLKAPADLRIIGSSIQLLAEQQAWEKWSNFPRERDRLYKLINDTDAKGVVVISGDRHRAEICRADDTGIGYPLYDITSSSLTNPSKPDKQDEPNHRRLGKNFIDLNYGMLLIDWEKKNLSMEILDADGAVVLQQSTAF